MKKSTTCGARSRASWRSAATAPRCGSRPPPIVRTTWSTSCCSSSRSRRSTAIRCPGPVNLNRFSAIYDLAQRADLKYPPFTPGLPARLVGATDLFAVIRQRDVLLHHPYRSFGPVMDLLRQAASDPGVLAIKQTLYRTGDQLADRRRAAGRGARGQGRHRHHRAACALRRRSQHRAVDAAAGSRRARHVRRGRLQDPRQDDADRAARSRRHSPLLPPGHRQLPSAHRARSTPTMDCSPATRTSAATCTKSSCSSPA